MRNNTTHKIKTPDKAMTSLENASDITKKLSQKT